MTTKTKTPTAKRTYVKISEKLAALFVKRYENGWTLQRIANSAHAQQAIKKAGGDPKKGLPVTTVRAVLVRNGVEMRRRGRPSAA